MRMTLLWFLLPLGTCAFGPPGRYPVKPSLNFGRCTSIDEVRQATCCWSKLDDETCATLVTAEPLSADSDTPVSVEVSAPLPTAVDAVAVDEEEVNGAKTAVISLLFVIAVLSALDRVAMSVALVPMAEEFGFTDSVKGSISSLFSVGYGLLILPSGFLVANASPRLVMASGIVIWSLATIATPVASGLATMAPLLAARAFVGAAESVVMPTLQKLLAAWTSPEEKSVAFATIFAGFQSGTIAAYLLSPLVMDWFGDWREIFTVYGSFGLILLVPWLVFAKDSPDVLKRTASADPEPVSDLTVADTEPTGWDKSIQQLQEAPWKDFAKSKGAWAMLLAHCSKNWGLYNTLAWTPTFYYEQYGIGVRDSVWLSVLPSVSGALGGLLAGNLADGIIRNLSERTDETLTNVRKVFQSIALLGPALALSVLASDIPDDPQIAQFFLMAAVGFQAFVVAGFEAGNQEKAGQKWAGLLYSVTSLPAVMFGTFGVWFVGQVLDSTHDWSVVFYLNSFVNILGATAFLALYNSKREFD